MGIVAGKHALPLGAVWAAIALGAALDRSCRSTAARCHAAAMLGRRLPARFPSRRCASPSAPCKEGCRCCSPRVSGGDALYRTA
ncbi:hypothetical protein M8494_15690 [Serratia ureilytica]